MTEFLPGQPLPPTLADVRERTVYHARLPDGSPVTVTMEGNIWRWRRLRPGAGGLEYGEGGRAQLEAWLKA